jgi:octaprenyl-diphosphate synthase
VAIDDIRSFLQPEMNEVDSVIRECLHSDVVLIRQMAEYIINSGGKRLRPILVILSAGSLNYSGKNHHQLAAIIEFIHTATLLHDDVVDDSKLRRGNPTANALFGNSASVLVGDFLYSRAFQMMVDVQNMRIMDVLADATNTIAEGEVMQLLNCHNADINEDQYLQVIRYKTAKLFEVAMRVGAIIGSASESLEESAATYGIHLGTAFQLIDDVLDYSGDHAEIGKNLGDDLAEGKPTLPLIYAMKYGTPEQSQVVRHAIEQGGLEEFAPVLQIVQQTGALEYAKKQAQHEADIACQAIAQLPNSKHKDCLLQLAQFAVSRNY